MHSKSCRRAGDVRMAKENNAKDKGLSIIILSKIVRLDAWYFNLYKESRVSITTFWSIFAWLVYLRIQKISKDILK